MAMAMPMEKPKQRHRRVVRLDRVEPSKGVLGRLLHGVQRVVDGRRQREPGEARTHGHGRAKRGHCKSFGQQLGQAEEVVLVGAVAVQQDQEGLACALGFIVGPQDNRGWKCGASVMDPFLQLPAGNNLRWRRVARHGAGYERE